MELHYCKHTREENTEYKTWVFVITDFHYFGLVGSSEEGWTKQPKPPELTKKEALEWFIVSNNEDLHFIEKEREAFDEWRITETIEIAKAQKENAKILKYYLE